MDKRNHKERFDAGLKTRREVLGAGYVDKAQAAVDDFSAPFAELLNTYCWNDIWNRPGLDRKTRSMLNLAMLAGSITPAKDMCGRGPADSTPLLRLSAPRPAALAACT